MKFSENWLRSIVNPPLASGELAHALTMAGLEVEAHEPAAPQFFGVVVGEVLSVGKHPDADRLNICQVNVGGEAPLTVVCGAPNVAAGAKAPCALVGARLPEMQIRQARVRGVESSGMLCSARELGLAAESSGLLLLPQDAPPGKDFREYYGLDDTLFTLKLTPNRADCLSVAGIAREVAALTGAELAVAEVSSAAVTLADCREVTVEDAAACPRYCGRIVRGADLRAATPLWMVRRLEKSGVRAISVAVDITNYVMLETGQPLHAFDLAKISGGIRVRLARAGEELLLLNGQTLQLAPDMLVIADQAKPLALAGIMGGEESAVGDATCDVFLESAFFSPSAIAGKTRRLGFSTDSAHRFERGVDYAATRAALERATQLLLEICGGQAGPVVEAGGELPARDPIVLRAARARKVLGIELDPAQTAELLRRLRLDFSAAGEVFRVVPPSYRFDLAIEEDLIEELARLHGYDRIPASPPRTDATMLPQSDGWRTADELRRLLAARGYQEIVGYSFVDAEWERDLCGNAAPVALRNPIAAQMGVMRSSLFGGLVDCLRCNLNRKQPRARLFEIGCCFGGGEGGYTQAEKLGGLCYGAAFPDQWGMPARAADFYDAKSDVEALFAPQALHFEAAQHPALHPGRSARVLLNGAPAGWLGELHPQWCRKYDLPLAPLLFELDVAALNRRLVPRFSEVSRFPPVIRDLAVVVEEKASVQALLDSMHDALPAYVTAIELFDVYRGKGIENMKKSLAFRVWLQDTQKTLTDAEADASLRQLLGILERAHNAKLRT